MSPLHKIIRKFSTLSAASDKDVYFDNYSMCRVLLNCRGSNPLYADDTPLLANIREELLELTKCKRKIENMAPVECFEDGSYDLGRQNWTTLGESIFLGWLSNHIFIRMRILNDRNHADAAVMYCWCRADIMS